MSCVLADDEVMLTIKPGQVCTIDDSVCWKLLGNQCLNMPIYQYINYDFVVLLVF